MHANLPIDDFDPGKAGLLRLALTVPPLPSTLLEARSVMDDLDGVTSDQVRSMIAHDPVVAAQLLRVANAAHYGSQRTVDGVARAADLLGPVTVIGIVTGMNLVSGSPSVPGRASACFARLIRHSIATANFVSVLRDQLAPCELSADTAYTAGLLHDLGRILTIHHDPERAVAVYEEPGVLLPDEGDDMLQLEQLAFGHDHTEAGEYVARKLDLPDTLVRAIRYHHHADTGGLKATEATLVRMVTAADIAASALGFPFATERSWDQCTEHPVWEQLPVRDLPRLFEALRSRAASQADSIDRRVRPPVARAQRHNRSDARSPRLPDGGA